MARKTTTGFTGVQWPLEALISSSVLVGLCGFTIFHLWTDGWSGALVVSLLIFILALAVIAIVNRLDRS